MQTRRIAARAVSAVAQRHQSMPAGAVGAAAGAAATASRHPLLTVGAGIATAIVGYTVFAQGKKDDTVFAENTQEIAPRVQGKFGEPHDREYPYDWRDDAQDRSLRDRANVPDTKFAELKDDLKTKTKELKAAAIEKFDDAKQSGKELKEKASDKLDDAKDAINESSRGGLMGRMRDRVNQSHEREYPYDWRDDDEQRAYRVEKAGARIDELKADAKQKGKELKDKASDKFDGAKDKLEEKSSGRSSRDSRQREYPYEWRDDVDFADRGQLKDTKSKAQEQQREVKRDASDALDKAKQKGKELKNQAEETVDDAKVKSLELKRNASAKFEEAKDKAKEIKDDAVERVEEMGDEAKQKFYELRRAAAERFTAEKQPTYNVNSDKDRGMDYNRTNSYSPAQQHSPSLSEQERQFEEDEAKENLRRKQFALANKTYWLKESARDAYEARAGDQPQRVRHGEDHETDGLGPLFEGTRNAAIYAKDSIGDVQRNSPAAFADSQRGVQFFDEAGNLRSRESGEHVDVRPTVRTYDEVKTVQQGPPSAVNVNERGPEPRFGSDYGKF